MTPRKRLSIALILVLTLLIAAQGCIASAETSVTIRKSATVYAAMNTGAKKLKLTAATKVPLSGILKGWACVKKDGVTAYVPLKNTSLEGSLTAYALKKAALYKSKGGKKIGTLAKEDAVSVDGISGKYAHVTTQDGKKGYVKTAVLSSKKTVTSGDKADVLINAAKAMLGQPYSKMDCSRFTQYCFKLIGIDIPSSVKSQGYMTKYDRVKTIGALQKGDLVVFNTVDDDDLSDHVGIYIGNKQFIHSSSAAGKVLISDFTNYYTRNFSWGLRIIK